jgi:hypothetical protein
MLEAKKLQLETEGVTVRDSEFSCGLRSFGTQDYEQAAKELTLSIMGCGGVGIESQRSSVTKTRILFLRLFATVQRNHPTVLSHSFDGCSTTLIR